MRPYNFPEWKSCLVAQDYGSRTFIPAYLDILTPEGAVMVVIFIATQLSKVLREKSRTSTTAIQESGKAE